MNDYVLHFYYKRIPNEVADKFYTFNWKEIEATNPKAVIGVAMDKNGEIIAAFKLQLMEKLNEIAYNFIIKNFEVVPELQHEGYGVGVLSSLWWKYRPEKIEVECIPVAEDNGESVEWFKHQGFIAVDEDPDCNILYKNFK